MQCREHFHTPYVMTYWSCSSCIFKFFFLPKLDLGIFVNHMNNKHHPYFIQLVFQNLLYMSFSIQRTLTYPTVYISLCNKQ